MAKLQLLTLCAKLLTLSQASSQATHLRTLSLLFDYLTTLARYDLVYQVRDRARFLKGLLSAAGIGAGVNDEAAKMRLEEEDFKRGIQVEDLTGSSSSNLNSVEQDEGRALTIDQVKTILFEGKQSSSIGNTHPSSSSGTLGTFSLSLGSKKLIFQHSYEIPPYPETAPPSSIRDPPKTSDLKSSEKESSSTAMRGFGSDSFNSRGSNLNSSSRNNSGKIVLTPTNFSNGSSGRSGSNSPAPLSGAKKAGFKDLDDFYGEDSSSEEESEEEEDEDGSEEDDEDEEEEEGESGEEEEGSTEEEEDDDPNRRDRPLI